jgi:hypothetical protein
VSYIDLGYDDLFPNAITPELRVHRVSQGFSLATGDERTEQRAKHTTSLHSTTIVLLHELESRSAHHSHQDISTGYQNTWPKYRIWVASKQMYRREVAPRLSSTDP